MKFASLRRAKQQNWIYRAPLQTGCSMNFQLAVFRVIDIDAMSEAKQLRELMHGELLSRGDSR